MNGWTHVAMTTTNSSATTYVNGATYNVTFYPPQQPGDDTGGEAGVREPRNSSPLAPAGVMYATPDM